MIKQQATHYIEGSPTKSKLKDVQPGDTVIIKTGSKITQYTAEMRDGRIVLSNPKALE